MTLATLSEKAKAVGKEGCGINALSEMENGIKVRDETLLAMPELLGCKINTPQELIDEAKKLSERDPWPENMEQFGACVATVRNDRKFTQEQLAEKLGKLAKTGCNDNIVSAMERGEKVNPIWPPLVSKALKCKTQTMQGVIDEAQEILARHDPNKIPEDLKTLAKNILLIRSYKKIPQDGLQGVDRAYVSRAENADPVTVTQLINIAKALKCKEPTIEGIALEAELIRQQINRSTSKDTGIEALQKPSTSPKPKTKPEFISNVSADSKIDGYTHAQLWKIIARHMISNSYSDKKLAHQLDVPTGIITASRKGELPEGQSLNEHYMRLIPSLFIEDKRRQKFSELESQASNMPAMSKDNIMNAITYFAEKSPDHIEGLATFSLPEAHAIATKQLSPHGNSERFTSLAHLITEWQIQTGKGGGKGRRNTISDDAIDLTDSWVDRIHNSKQPRDHTSFRDF